MTRDEATKIFEAHGCWPFMSSDHCERWLTTFEALGMLKIDEPKDISARVVDVLEANIPHTFIGDVLNGLDKAGLKIVEK